MIVASPKVPVSIEVLSNAERPFAIKLEAVFADVSGYSALVKAFGVHVSFSAIFKRCLFRKRATQTMKA